MQKTRKPVHWKGCGSGAPFEVDPSHPLWQVFLDSGSKSPIQFFRAFLAPPTYFQNPRPFTTTTTNNNNVLPTKVSQLLDRFGPGAFSYQPFKKKCFPIDTNNNTDEEEVDVEEQRRRLYVDHRRPRPFYRVTRNRQNSQSRHRMHTPMALQDIVRVSLVQRLGLDQLGQVLASVKLIPQVVQDRVLTFQCQDFEHVSDADVSVDSGTVTYKVMCNHDKQIYRATFFTSEVDKAVSNLWNEHRRWLAWNDNVVPILALVADLPTENVFLITKDFCTTLPQYLCDTKIVKENEKKLILDSLGRCKRTLLKMDVCWKSEQENVANLIVQNLHHTHEWLIRNPLLLKTRGKSISVDVDSVEEMFQTIFAQIENS